MTLLMVRDQGGALLYDGEMLRFRPTDVGPEDFFRLLPEADGAVTVRFLSPTRIVTEGSPTPAPSFRELV